MARPGRTFAVNTIAPFAARPVGAAPCSSSGRQADRDQPSMGSIDDNGSGGFVAYRSSKSALNMAWNSLSVDNPGVPGAVLHPGWVQTRMGGLLAPLLRKHSVAGMRLGHRRRTQRRTIAARLLQL